ANKAVTVNCELYLNLTGFFLWYQSVNDRIFDERLQQKWRQRHIIFNIVTFCNAETEFPVKPKLLQLEIILQALDFFIYWDQRFFRIFERQPHQLRKFREVFDSRIGSVLDNKT